MANKLHIRSVIICDDVRREDNGKEILIGVYNGVILVPRFPSVLRQLIVRIEYEWKGVPAHKFKATVTAEGGQKILEADGQTTLVSPDDPAAISIGAGPIRFEKQTQFNIRFGIDGPPRKIGWFSVRAAPKP
jgi:hypothetical protein